MLDNFLICLQGNKLLGRQILNRLPSYLKRFTVADNDTNELDGQNRLILLINRLDEINKQVKLPGCGDMFHILYWRSLVYIGPIWIRGNEGCGQCLISRVINTSYGPGLDAAGNVQRIAGAARLTPIFAPNVISTIATIVAVQVKSYKEGDYSHSSKRIVFVVNVDTGTVSREWLVPDSSCANCAPPANGTLPIFAARKNTSDFPLLAGYRQFDAKHLGNLIEPTYIQTNIGIVKEVLNDLQSPFATCTLEIRDKWGRNEFTIGRSETYKKSRMIAVLESLERYCGMRPEGIGGILRASFREVRHQAVDPRSLGLHPDESYARSSFPFAPFSEDLPIDWVWGYSFRNQAPILVPASIAFYGYQVGAKSSLVFETSNGCALGSSIEEATFHGFLEVVERDSFLMSWYLKLELPELSLTSIPDVSISILLRKAELFSNCRFRAFLSTMEHKIPSLVLVAITNYSDGPSIMACGGSHPDLQQALKSSLYELTGLVLRLRDVYPKKRDKALAMLDNPDLVMSIEDHPLVNALPEASSRFSFLLNRKTEPIAFHDSFECSIDDNWGIADKLDWAVKRVLATGLDLVVVDQTVAELKTNGLNCVKVIIPGLLPMTFGHHFRRVNLGRLVQIPVPYESAIRNPHEIGAEPHPFP